MFSLVVLFSSTQLRRKSKLTNKCTFAISLTLTLVFDWSLSCWLHSVLVFVRFYLRSGHFGTFQFLRALNEHDCLTEGKMQSNDGSSSSSTRVRYSFIREHRMTEWKEKYSVDDQQQCQLNERTKNKRINTECVRVILFVWSIFCVQFLLLFKFIWPVEFILIYLCSKIMSNKNKHKHTHTFYAYSLQNAREKKCVNEDAHGKWCLRCVQNCWDEWETESLCWRFFISRMHASDE